MGARSIGYVAGRRASRTARNKQIALLAVSTRRILARKLAQYQLASTIAQRFIRLARFLLPARIS